MQTTFTKSITAQFATIGKKRQRLVGQLAELRDESGLLLFSQSFATKPQAEQALDSLVHELLIDYAERGLVDTLPELVTEPRRFTTVTVKACRSYERTITVFPDSTVELVKHDPSNSANTWMALLVDGRHYNLAMWKHTLGRPELTEALNQALVSVQDAIAALTRAPEPVPA